jgi:Golgi phosphoprotein 3
MKLRFAEEITLLMLNDEDGEFVRVPGWSMQCAFAGAVLMDLALENRIDTDLKRLVLIDPTPVGDDMLDPALALIARSTETYDARHWVDHLADGAEEIREQSLARLVERGILRREEDRFLWVFQSRRYPLVDGEAEREVKLRIMEVLFGNDIPHPRDIVLICLVDACGVLRELLTARELERASERIDQVRRLDLIGQAVSKAVWDIQSSIALAMHPTF